MTFETLVSRTLDLTLCGKAALAILAGSFTLCVIACFQRLHFSPLAGIPGPKLAAATYWYEFYFDVVKRGRYFEEIGKMHKQYGPIVRINPHEVHVNDPSFYPILYSGATQKRDKWTWALGMFGGGTSAFATAGHDHHRLRRSPLNPLFSRSAIRQMEPLIHSTAEILCRNLNRAAGSDTCFDLGLTFTVFAADVISAYCFGESFGLLENTQFAPEWLAIVAAPSELGHLIKQMPWLIGVLQWFPTSFGDMISPAFKRFYKLQHWMSSRVQAILDDQSNKETTCVFQSLLDTDLLPPTEKSVQRLKGEGQTLIGAGTLTMANVLKLITFHMLNEPTRWKALAAELDEEFPDHNEPLSLTKLEKLPLLTAYIKEGLRIGYGVSHRLSLISHDPFQVQGFTIPPGTPVSMSAIFMHDNPEVFPDPRVFRPERWLGNIEERREQERNFVAFSKGTRMCLGMHLAWAEIYIVIATLVRNYSLTLFETTLEDVEMAHDLFDPAPKVDSNGLRVTVKAL